LDKSRAAFSSSGTTVWRARDPRPSSQLNIPKMSLVRLIGAEVSSTGRVLWIFYKTPKNCIASAGKRNHYNISQLTEDVSQFACVCVSDRELSNWEYTV